MSKKRDARIARALERQINQQKKSVRLVERIKDALPVTRVVRLGANPDSIYQMLRKL